MFHVKQLRMYAEGPIRIEKPRLILTQIPKSLFIQGVRIEYPSYE